MAQHTSPYTTHADHAGPRDHWTRGVAKWAAVSVLGGFSIVGMIFSISTRLERERAMRVELDMRLDLNAATHAELQLLPGIGPSLAEQIIADRERNGPYPSADALDRVPGIGPRTIAQLRAHVRTD